MRRLTFSTDLAFSLCIVAFGILIAVDSLQMPFGSVRRMGPGFFPVCIGVIIAGLGVASLFDDNQGRDRSVLKLRGLICTCLGLIAFAVLLEPLGMLAAITALVILIRLGTPEALKPLPIIAVILGLAAVGYGLFVVIFHLPLRLI